MDDQLEGLQGFQRGDEHGRRHGLREAIAFLREHGVHAGADLLSGHSETLVLGRSSSTPPSEYEMSNRLEDETERHFEDFAIAVSNVRVARSERDVTAAWDIVDEKQSALRVHIREREALLRKENGLLVEIAQDNHDSLEMLRLRVDSAAATPSSREIPAELTDLLDALEHAVGNRDYSPFDEDYIAAVTADRDAICALYNRQREEIEDALEIGSELNQLALKYEDQVKSLSSQLERLKAEHLTISRSSRK